MRQHADGLFHPGPAGMGGENFHARKILGQRIEMDRPAVVEADAAAAVGVGAKHGKADVEHRRFAARLQDLPDVIEPFVARIKPLVGRMKLETDNCGVFHQLFGVARNRLQVFRIGIQRREHAGKRLGVIRHQLDHMIVGVARAFMNRRGMPADQQSLDVLLQVEVGKTFRRLRHVFQIAAKIAARVGIETAGARVNMNVNGAHRSSPQGSRRPTDSLGHL